MQSSVFFIIDGPRLIGQAYLLAASIMRHRQPGQAFIAYCRADAAPLPDLLRDVLDRAGIGLRLIPGTAPGDPSPWTSPYPIGNKVMAALDDRAGEISVFLDTDMVLNGPVDFAAALDGAAAGAVLSDYRTLWPDITGWLPVYAHFGLTVPALRPGVLRRPNVDYPPYFNGGMVAFRNGPLKGGPGFAERWMDLCQRLDRATHLTYERINIDQITLALLYADPAVALRMLPQRLNYNVMAWGEPADPAAEAAIVHYHKVGRLWRAPSIGPAVVDMLRALLTEAEIATIDQQHPDELRWRFAAKRQLLA